MQKRKILNISAIMFSVFLSGAAQTASAQSAGSTSIASGIELGNLTEKQQRKLTFYANKVAVELIEATKLEQTGTADEVDVKLAAARRAADRLKGAASEANVAQAQIAGLVLRQILSMYSGPIPKSLVDERGLLNVTAFIYGGNGGGNGSGFDYAAKSGDYVDLLRAEEAGGVKN